MITSRRSFLQGLTASLVAAPAIVRASSLMPVRRVIGLSFDEQVAAEIALLKQRMNECYAVTRQNMSTILYSNPEWMPVEFTGLVPRYSS